jgi:hypothetical protein
MGKGELGSSSRAVLRVTATATVSRGLSFREAANYGTLTGGRYVMAPSLPDPGAIGALEAREYTALHFSIVAHYIPAPGRF